MKRLINEMPVLATLRPKPGQRDSAGVFDVGPARASKDPSVRSVGITGQITGSRADEILADDVEALNNSATEEARRKLAEQVREFDAVLKPDGSITYLGTPQSFESMYRELPERGYDLRIWPAEVPEKPSVYQGRLAPYVLRRIAGGARSGAPLDPDRFPGKDLAERRASYGRAGYALQFQLDTSQTDALRYPLKLSDILAMPLDSGAAPPSRVSWSGDPGLAAEDLPALGFPGDRFRRPAKISEERAPFERAVLAIDPSGRGRDETGFAVVKVVNAQLYLTAAGGLRGGYDPASLTRLAQLARAEAVDEILVEANFGDGMFARLLAPPLAEAGVRARVEEVRSQGQKERRIIDTLEPVLAQHRLIVCDEPVREDYESAKQDLGYALFYQLTRLTRERGALAHDDRLDALAMAVARVGRTLERSVDSAEQAGKRRRERAEAKALKQALEKTRPKRWRIKRF